MSSKLLAISTGESPITAISFSNTFKPPKDLLSAVEFHNTSSLNELSIEREFYYLIAMDLIDKRNSPWLLECVYTVLKPGSQLIIL